MPLSLTPAPELETRLAAARARLREANVDAALIIQRADLIYFTGTAQNGVLCLPAKGEPLFLVQRSFNRARQESPLPNLVPLESMGRLAETLRTHGHGNWSRLGLELDTLPARDYLRLAGQFPGVELKDISMEIREQRSVKSAWEVSQVEGAGQILCRTFRKLPEILAAAEREIDACAAVEGELRRQRHQGLVRIRRWNMELNPTTLVSGSTASLPSAFDGAAGMEGLTTAVPQSGGERPLRPGEPIVVDLVAGHNGYLADMTRIFVIGKLQDPELEEAHRFTLQLQDEVARRLRPGAVCGTIYNEILAMVAATPWQAGFMGWAENRVSFIGHGVGLELDELPILARGAKMTLREGSVVAVEPKFFFGDRGGVGIENTWVVTPEGGRNLTADGNEEVISVR